MKAKYCDKKGNYNISKEYLKRKEYAHLTGHDISKDIRRKEKLK